MLFRSALLVAAATTLAACESLITGGPLIIEGRPTGQIVFVNQTSYVLDVVVISECEVGSYGLNRLPSGATIPPGTAYSFTVSSGCWDVGAGAVGIGDALQRLTVEPGGITEYTIAD